MKPGCGTKQSGEQPMRAMMNTFQGMLTAMGVGLVMTVLGGTSMVQAEEKKGVSQICVAPLQHGFEVPATKDDTETDEEAVVLVDETTGGIDNTAVALPDRHVTLEVETQGEINAQRKRAISLGPISTTARSLIKVREDGKLIQSFLYKRGRGQKGDYCVVFRTQLEAWAILPMKEVGEWCSCDHAAYVAPVIPEVNAETAQ
jgi:hypothetical protein